VYAASIVTVVCLCVRLSVRHDIESRKNELTDRDAIWDVDSCGPRNRVLGGGPDLPVGRGSLGGDLPAQWAIVKYR